MFGKWFQEQRISQWSLPNGFSRQSIQFMVVLKCSKQDFLHEDSLKKKELIMKKLLHPLLDIPQIKTILALASKMRWKLHQMDVKTTFLNGLIEEEVYI